jgi:hypothetical protein
MVIEQFSAKFQVKFSAELRNALGNFFGLRLEVRRVVKTYFEHLSFFQIIKFSTA